MTNGSVFLQQTIHCLKLWNILTMSGWAEKTNCLCDVVKSDKKYGIRGNAEKYAENQPSNTFEGEDNLTAKPVFCFI